MSALFSPCGNTDSNSVVLSYSYQGESSGLTLSSAGTEDLDNGEIYKMELDGRIVGKFGHGGKQLKEFMAVHEIDCRNENEIYVGEISNWRVQKLILHPNQMK
jgi:hypothetical protein